MNRLKDWRTWAGLVLALVPVLAGFFSKLSPETIGEISMVCTMIAMKLGINMPQPVAKQVEP